MIDRDKLFEEKVVANSHGQTIEELADALDEIIWLKHRYKTKSKELEELQNENRNYKAAMDDVLVLIDNSYGVSGLHLNGDVAPWGELMSGGRFEGWLMSIDELQKGEQDNE